MQPDLGLECRELQIDSEFLERFVRRDVIRSIPFGDYSAYNSMNEQLTDFVVSYLSARRPHLTDIRFVNSEGGEPQYIRVSSTMEYQDPEVWDIVYSWLPKIFSRLSGAGNMCLISGFVF